MIYSLLQWEQGARLYYSDSELLPIPLTSAGAYSHAQGEKTRSTSLGWPRCTPGCSMYRKSRCREHLGAMVLYTKCWLGAQRSWDRGHDRKKTNRQIQWQSQSWWWGCAMCSQLKNQEQISFLHSPFHRLFNFFPLTPLSFCFSGLHYPLPLFPWHSTFYPFCFFFFLFSSVLFLSASFVSMLILSCFSSLFLLTFLSDS